MGALKQYQAEGYEVNLSELADLLWRASHYSFCRTLIQSPVEKYKPVDGTKCFNKYTHTTQKV